MTDPKRGPASGPIESTPTGADAKSIIVEPSRSTFLLLPEFTATTIARIQVQGGALLEKAPAAGGRGKCRVTPDGFKASLMNRRMRRTHNEQARVLEASQAPPKSVLDRIRAMITRLQIYQAKGPNGIDPRTLTKHQVAAVVAYFTTRQPEVTIGAIATLLDRGTKEIRAIRRRLIREDAAVLLPELNTQGVYAEITHMKQTAQDMALAAGDYEAAWDIEREYREELVSLGLLEAAPKRIELRDLRTTLTEQMAEFMHEFGTPSPKELIARLRGILPAAGGANASGSPGNGNGNGNGNGGGKPDILVVPIRPSDSAGSDREPQKDGPQNQG